MIRTCASVFLVLLISSCYTPPSESVWTWEGRSISGFWLEVMAESREPEWSDEDISPYLAYYGFETEGHSVATARPTLGKYQVFLLRLTPPVPRARAVILHGYMGNAGHYAPMANILLASGVEVILLDLPGHGLSSGARNTIESFHDYGDSLAALLPRIIPESGDGLPLFGIGHSTGCSAFVDLLGRHPAAAAQFDRLVFAAPLVRISDWDLKLTAINLLVHGTIGLPRGPFVSSGSIANEEFRDFQMQGDPLYTSIFDPTWVHALDRWNEEVAAWQNPAWAGKILVVQGTSDDVVDWPWNLERLKALLPQLEKELFPGLSHNILQEKPGRIGPVIERIRTFLE